MNLTKLRYKEVDLINKNQKYKEMLNNLKVDLIKQRK
jgi:hypothetical protein